MDIVTTPPGEWLDESLEKALFSQEGGINQIFRDGDEVVNDNIVYDIDDDLEMTLSRVRRRTDHLQNLTLLGGASIAENAFDDDDTDEMSRAMADLAKECEEDEKKYGLCVDQTGGEKKKRKRAKKTGITIDYSEEKIHPSKRKPRSKRA